MSVDAGAYRLAMSRLATGVTVVTTRAGGRHELMTANAVMSVSLSPTLLVVSVAERARWLRAVVECGHFVVNVLSHEHSDVARWCADSARHDRPGHLLGHETTVSPLGLLMLPDALATLHCHVYAEHPAGDHRLVVGEVDAVETSDATGEPLLFFDRAFTTTLTAAPRLQRVAAS